MAEVQRASRGAANKLLTMNMQLEQFTEQFTQFCNYTKVVDNKLCENLLKLVEKIETYLDNSPLNVATPPQMDINFDDQFLARIIYCDICETEIKENFQSIHSHIRTAKHCTIKKLVETGNYDAIKEDNVVSKKALRIEIKKEKALRMERFPGNKKLHRKLVKLIKSNFIDVQLESISKTAISLKQIPAYDKIRESLFKSLKESYPSMNIYYFGSRITGLGNVDSDLDIYIDINKNYHRILPADEVKTYVKNIKTLLESNNVEWCKFTPILSARKPILKVYNKNHRIDCDISFCSLGECNTKLMAYLFELQPICQKICLFAKRLQKSQSYGNCFTSYSLSLLVVFYQQIKKRLPSVRDLQQVVEQSSFVGPWQVDFARLPLSTFNMQPIADSALLTELISFYRFYSEFDFGKSFVCPYTGTIVAKKNFDSMKDIFERYENHCKTCEEKDLFQINKPMCVQDPLDLSHNVAKAVTDKVIVKFRQDCQLIALELEARLSKTV